MKLIIDIEPRYCKDMDSDVKGLYYEAINRITEAVRNGIPYEERPHGKWIKIFENPFTNGYVCSVCGHKIQVTEQFLPKVTECEVCGANMTGSTDKALEERPQDEMIETKHRLNLLIGVLYSNQLISENDIEYIEDSIKELMKGEAKND